MEHIPVEPHFDIIVNEDDILTGAKEIVKFIRPSWPMHTLNFKLFTNGITNRLIGVWSPRHYTDMVLIRIYGHNTNLLIDRKEEIRNIRILHKAGYTHSIYATFNNGMAYQFLEGDTLTSESVRQPEIYWLVAKRMAQMHRVNTGHEIPKNAAIWEKTEKVMHMMPKKFLNSSKQQEFEKLIKPYSVLQSEYHTLKENLLKLNNPVVFAHNDLLLTNILYNTTQKTVTFIDYEYTGYNYQAFDIANHFAEFAGVEKPNYSLYPDMDFQREWLRIYLQAYHETSDIANDDVTLLYVHVNHFVLLSHFFWGCWSLVQSQLSAIDFDFLKYAATRFDEYFKKKELIELKISDVNL